MPRRASIARTMSTVDHRSLPPPANGLPEATGEAAPRPRRAPSPELIPVGDGAWVARDPGVPDNDARRVVAYLERKNGRVHVLWVRDRRDASSHATLGAALREVALACVLDRRT